MKIRRYYDRNKSYNRYYHPAVEDVTEFVELMKKSGFPPERALAVDTAEWEILLDADEQESSFFDCLQRVHDNPRWYLDNLESLPTFRVNITSIFPKPVKGGPKLRTRQKKDTTL